MEIPYLKKLIRIVEHSNVDEIEVEEEGLRIRIAKNSHGNSVAPATQSVTPVAQNTQPIQTASPAATSSEPEVTYHEIKSPIVGTFYRAPAPDADPYVEVGQSVQPKTVLCIIEAMKLMNEIESDVSGRIAKICVENGKPVEYNQTLFLIEPM
jgi:acetyl-CoA carboxylase biotin carboxyl carrier protein